jgi:ATP:ADP antiporter, AAA family
VPIVPAPVVEEAVKLAPLHASGDTPAQPEARFLGYTALTWSKIIPLGLMFFCILFNYTILRDTKVEMSVVFGRHPACLLGAEMVIAHDMS